MRSFRRRHTPPATIPWSLGELLREGPEPLDERPRAAADHLDIALLLPSGASSVQAAGLPAELVTALESNATVRVVAPGEANTAASADVVLAVGWGAGPDVLRLRGVRARALIATADPAPPAHLGWTNSLPVLGPQWLGGTLVPAADAVYGPMAVHRRDDLVLVHGDDVLALLAAAELLRRRPGLSIAVSGAATELALPFECMSVEAGAQALAHAFASATVAFAPPVRGWKPAATAMLACGQPVVAAAGDERAAAALGDAVAFAASPTEAADAAERLIDDLALRADRVRAGLALVEGGWQRTAAELVRQIEQLI